MARILLVDDDPRIHCLVTEMLEPEGHVIRSIMTAIDIVAECERFRPGIVILDLLLPGKDGLEALREINKMYAGVKVIAISGGGRIDKDTYLNMAEKMGVQRTLTKPFDKSHLLDAVACLLQ